MSHTRGQTRDPFGAVQPVSYALSAARILAYLVWTMAAIPMQLVLHLISKRLAVRFPVFYHRQCCHILGIRLEIVGERSKRRPVLFVGNHISYVDITVYGATIAGSFVAKHEVADWPLFGLLARLQRTVFIDRSRSQAGRSAGAVRTRLNEGGNVIIFPEGTSGDGNRVLPFRSALLPSPKAGDDGWGEVTIQPVTLSYTKLDGMPLGRGLRPFVAWYGQMSMAEHFVQLFGLGRLTARVEFHPPVTVSDFPSRKALTDHCHRVVSDGYVRAMTRR